MWRRKVEQWCSGVQLCAAMVSCRGVLSSNGFVVNVEQSKGEVKWSGAKQRWSAVG